MMIVRCLTILLALASVAAVHAQTPTFFGDSITVGDQVASQFRYPRLIAVDRGWTFDETTNVKAVNGAQTADQADQIYATVVSGSSQVFFYTIGANDERRYHPNPAGLTLFRDALGAELAWLAIPESAKMRGGDTRIVYTGSWNTTVAYNGLGRTGVAPGSRATFDVTGSTIYIASIVQDGTAGSFSVTVDGVSQGTFSSTPAMRIKTVVYGRTYTPRLIRITGLANTSHHVIIEALGGVNAANPVYLDWAAGVAPGSIANPPKVYSGSVTRQTPAGYTANGGSDQNVVEYNIAIKQTVYNLVNDGLNITFVDTASAISAYLDLIDTIHLNIAGHEKFKNAFVNVMNGGSSAEMIVPQFVVWSGSVDFPSLAADSCDEMAIALKGAVEGDPVLASIPVALADPSKQTAFFAYVSSPGVVTVRRCNVTATAAPNPPSVVVRVIALKY